MAIYAVEERYVPEDDRFWFLLVDITEKEMDSECRMQYRVVSKHETHRDADDAWKEMINAG